MTKPECETTRNLLVDYADGELAAADGRRVAVHLESCPDCRAELRLLERSLAIARAVWDEAASGAEARSESAGVAVQLPPQQHVPAHRAGRHWRFAAAVLAAAIVLVLVALPWLVPRGGATLAKRSTTDTNGSATGNTPDPAVMSAEEIDRYIARETSAARLCATAELLGTQPGLETERQRAEQYIIENYGDTTAGRRLLARAAPKPTKEPQS